MFCAQTLRSLCGGFSSWADMSLVGLVMPRCPWISRLIKYRVISLYRPCGKRPEEERREWETERKTKGSESTLVFQAFRRSFLVRVFVFIRHNRDPKKTDHWAWLNKPACTFLALASHYSPVGPVTSPLVFQPAVLAWCRVTALHRWEGPCCECSALETLLKASWDLTLLPTLSKPWTSAGTTPSQTHSAGMYTHLPPYMPVVTASHHNWHFHHCQY